MSQLVVSGVVIPVAPTGVSRSRLDATDRARALDNSYKVSVTGNPKRDFMFTTPPVSRANAEYYESVLALPSSQVCSGDLLAGGVNQLTFSEDLSAAAWTLASMTKTPGILDPFGGNNAFTLTATGASAELVQNLGAVSSLVRTNSVWLRRRTGTGVIKLFDPTDGAFLSAVPTSTWTPTTGRFTSTGAASVNRFFDLFIMTNGDAIDFFGPQLEDGVTASNYERTVTASVNTFLTTCCSEITSWTPVKVQSGHYVVINFTLHEI